NRFSEAIVEYRECIRIMPDNTTYYFWLGDACKEAKRYPEAIEAFQQGKRLSSPQSATADLRLAGVYVETKEYNKAFEAFTLATQLEPRNFEGFAGLGYVYYVQKQYAASLEPFQQ